MTYFGFLALFLGIPIAILSVLTVVDYRRGKWLPTALSGRKAWQVLLGLCIVAFVYTTPWDNYLVATRVWWYDPNLVSGIVFGWVPVEEYTFFLVQPVMTGLLFLLLARYLPYSPHKANSSGARWGFTLGGFVAWGFFAVVLLLTFISEDFAPATYLALEMTWALIPVLIQFAYGADTLLRHWRSVLLTIALSTLYLSFADALAIGSGTWTINPQQSLNVLLFGVLPVEEFVFFLLTNTLVVFGMALVLAEESQARLSELNRFAILRPLVRRLQTSGDAL